MMRQGVAVSIAAAMLVLPTVAHGADAKTTAPSTTVSSVDRARLAAADRLVKVANIEQIMRDIMPRILDMMMPIFFKSNSGREKEVRDIVSDAFGNKFLLTIPTITQKARDMYAEKFDLVELEALVAFYSSPVGRKMTAVGPQIQLEMMKFGQQAGSAAAQAAMPEILDRLKAANLNLPTSS